MSRELGSFVTSQPPVEDQFTAGQEQRAERHSGAVLSANLGPDRTDPDHPSEHWDLQGPFSFFLCIVLLCHFSGFSTVMETEAPAGGDLASDDITKGYSANQYNTKEHPPLKDTN